MTKSLLIDINAEIKLKEDFAEWLGVSFENIPEEILAEAGFAGRTLGMPLNNPGGPLSAAKGRSQEMDWVQGLKGDQERDKPSTYRDPLTAQPEMADRGEDPKSGDFIVVDGQPMKIKDVKQMYGNNFAYVQGMQKPVMVDNLELAKRVGKVNVFNKRQ